MKYSENGFWVQPLEQGVYRIGLSAKGQDDLGDVGFFELLATDMLSPDDAFIGVEAAKAVTELTAPLSAKVVKVNTALDTQPELLNEVDIARNWIVEVIDVSVEEYAALMDTDGLEK